MELSKAWCRATAHPSYQKDWSENNPSYGQCAVTALAIQDLYGGDIYECKVQGKRHYVNITPEGYLHDYTSSQFCDGQIVYAEMRPRTRTSLLKSHSVRERYELLKARLEEN
jgi:hypothetical protein